MARSVWSAEGAEARHGSSATDRESNTQRRPRAGGRAGRRVLAGVLALAGIGLGGGVLTEARAQVPTNRKVYLRSAGARLYLHALGGSKRGARETLHACPKRANHPNCQWIFEPSPTRAGAYYVKVSDKPLYLHAHGLYAHGGAKPGAVSTLHACPKRADRSNCQWYVERSATRPGALYLRSAGAKLYLHALGGAKPGARETLHACPKNADHSNCQWVIE